MTLAGLAVALTLPLAACSGEEGPSVGAAVEQSQDADDTAIEQSDAPALADAPELGACRALKPEDVTKPSDESDTVDCSEPHTAQTFVVGSFPENVTRGTSYDSPDLGAYIYEECTGRFADFVGGDDSIRIRSLVSWAWFRPTQDQWKDGARWFRCDIVGGTPVATAYAPLPENAKGLFSRGPVEAWMQCVDGATISAAPATPCTQEHTWRAVSIVKLQTKAKEKYPGDAILESRSRNFCSEQINAYLKYEQPEYEFAFSWFGKAEWKADNRRAICWAKTDA